MRINKFIAQATGLSRRAADTAIGQGRVLVNGTPPQPGQAIGAGDSVSLDGQSYAYDSLSQQQTTTIMLNKPPGYVVSRDGQGSRTIYELLPPHYQRLKPVGRLDKHSSGLLLLTDDGALAQRLTHPSYQKTKVYKVRLAQPLQPLHHQIINDHGVQLDDGNSRLQLERQTDGDDYAWRVTMHEGRNRQIRRTFAALGYDVSKLHRITFGEYSLDQLPSAAHKRIG